MQTSFDKEQFIYAGFFCRLAAYVLDSIFVAILLSFIKVPIGIVEMIVGSDVILFRPVLFQYNIFDIVYYLLSVAYFVVMTYFCGATLGKFLLKIKVVDAEGRKMSFMSIVFRETVGRYLSALIAAVGYIMVGLDSRKQGLHDKIADTCVVYKHSLVQKVTETQTVNEMEMQTLKDMQALSEMYRPDAAFEEEA